MKNKKTHFILLAIIILGAFLRFYMIGETAFDRDEFFELNSSYGYHKTGEWLAWDFGNEKPFSADRQDDSSNERAEIFRWQLSKLYLFSEPTEGLTRSLGAVWGVLGIFLVYLVATSMTGSRYIGLLAAFLTAVGYAEVLYSRRLRMYSMLFPAYLFFSWIVFKFYESEYRGKIKTFLKINRITGFNPSYLLPVIVAGLVSYNTHVLSAHIVPAVAVYAAIFLSIVLYKNNFSWREIFFNKYFMTVSVAVLGLLIYQLPFFSSIHKTINKNFVFFLSNPNEAFFFQYFSDFKYAALGAVLAVFGTWFLAIKMKKGKEAAFLFLSMAVPLAFAIFTWRRDISQRYIYFIQSFVPILSAVGVYGIIRLATDRVKNQNYKVVATIAILALLIFSIDFSYILSKKSSVNVYVQSSSYPDFNPVFDYVMKNKKDGDVMITRAYRSFYWRGNDIKVFDTKSLIRGKSGCEARVDEIVKNNPSGWVVFPSIDGITVCSEGRKYFRENLIPIADSSIPSSVKIYRWGDNL